MFYSLSPCSLVGVFVHRAERVLVVGVVAFIN